MKISVYISLARLFPGIDDSFIPIQNQAHLEFLTLWENLEIDFFSIPKKFNVKLIKKPPKITESIIATNRKFHPKIPSTEILFETELSKSDVEKVSKAYKKANQEIKPRGYPPINTKNQAVWDAFRIIQDYLFQTVACLNLAIPGGVRILDGVFFSGTKFNSYYKGLSHSIESAVMPVNEKQKSQLVNLKVLDAKLVWDWMISFSSYESGPSKTPVERALNAYLNLFSEGNYPSTAENVFWSVFALEAVLTQGNTGFRQQFINNLGKIIKKEPKKRIDSAYNFRSRVLHGDLNIPHPNRMDYTGSEYNVAEVYEGADRLIVYMMIMLQWLIEKNAKDITYKTEPVLITK